MIALSKIGRYAGRANLSEGSLLIALRAYLDSSGKIPAEKFITLAGIIANDETWKEFEAAWDVILTKHTPSAKYIHMREIMHMEEHAAENRKTGFDPALGWTVKGGFDLMNKCLSYMSSLDKARFHIFYCSVDLQAWNKLRAETYQMPDPVGLCNSYCSEVILGWYFYYYPGLVDPHKDTISYFFDRGEDFKKRFEDKWNGEKDRAEQTGEWNVWQRIDDVAAVEMKKTPGIQGADIIAWAINREMCPVDDGTAQYLAPTIRHVIPHHYIVWDEAKMREQFKPLLYLPALRLRFLEPMI